MTISRTVCARVALTTLLGLASAMSAASQPSAFGCSGLDSASSSLPSVEGINGVFYRVLTDLRMRHPMEDAVMQQMADLSKALAARGTTLIYVAVPTKSQAMPQFLPQAAADYGFDSATAQLVYGDIVDRLADHGVLAPDILSALLQSDHAQFAPDQLPFFQADFHWTSEGARRAAEAISAVMRAQPFYTDLPLGEYKTTELETTTAFSTMRRTLQAFCIDPLPPVKARAHLTELVVAPEGGVDSIFADEGAPVQIVLVGTSFSDSPLGNFAGYLSQYSGLDVVNYAVTGGNQFGAMTSYLTSRDFAESPPRFLVWENPIYTNLAQYGPDPLDELIAAAGTSCTVPLSATPSGTDGLTADLTGVTVGPQDVILADLGADGPRRAEFRLTTASGITRSAIMQRSDRMLASGRFFKPLGSIWHPDLASLTVTFDTPVLPNSTLTLCPASPKDALRCDRLLLLP